MTADQILAEIREANLSYLMLAQSLIRTDRAGSASVHGLRSPRHMDAYTISGLPGANSTRQAGVSRRSAVARTTWRPT